ncbi:MAG: hypothetical protein ACERJ1_07990 [Halodesulfovibrio sp.]|uniref:hypothetical protein n=1 Tax=Halodesulfovibrio sp. TaxID=1912772 RepID=UPI00359CC84C
MHTEEFIIDGQSYIWGPNGSRCLASKSRTTFWGLADPICMKTPMFWVIIRNDGDILFVLEKTEEELAQENGSIRTVREIYEMKIQWFEPLAENYRKLLWLNKKEYVESAYCQRTWQELVDFSVINRQALDYGKGGPGDWKQLPQGGGGFWLVMIEDMPYWSDGVGQIPFAIDTYRSLKGVKSTKFIGSLFAKGYPSVDLSSEYDNFFVLRGALFAEKKFKYHIKKKAFSSIIKPKPKISLSNLEIYEEEMHEVNPSELGNPLTLDQVERNALWPF